ncbi:MAG: hypothetical protein E6Q36_05695 [Chryseobacterium sp.]|nr:MAG: hypothetical protein E6Q36_05695 [Chryseobacterium sp.]
MLARLIIRSVGTTVYTPFFHIDTVPDGSVEVIGASGAIVMLEVAGVDGDTIYPIFETVGEKYAQKTTD